MFAVAYFSDKRRKARIFVFRVGHVFSVVALISPLSRTLNLFVILAIK
jgi:hypothetical protein